ncbi:MAG: hypothetical protein GY856_55620, partial [bacterium]|nr:hypothetical protein [bacterium]
MTDASSENRWWWETAALGERIPLAFVKLDRVGSTGEWEELPEEAVLERRARYTAGIESVARKMDAAQPLHFQGDGVMLFLTDDAAEPAAVRAFLTARALWERMWIDLSL